jgi:mannose-6-phosphate isomerase-like protein (cupin superfamily)
VGRLEDARSHTILGGSIAVRLYDNQTAGAVELSIPGGYPGPPLHVHPEFDETDYMVSGEIAVRIEDDADVAGAGTVVFTPRGTRHTFANPGAARARLLALLTPGGFEHYCRRACAGARGGRWSAGAGRARGLGEAYGSVPA